MENLGTQVPGASAESAIAQPQVKEETKPRRTSKRQNAAKAAEVEAATKDERTYEITLHDNREIPPNGQFIGVNGKQYILMPGVRTRVPASVLEVLNNAVHALPEINEKMQIVGMRSAPRLPYTLHPDV